MDSILNLSEVDLKQYITSQNMALKSIEMETDGIMIGGSTATPTEFAVCYIAVKVMAQQHNVPVIFFPNNARMLEGLRILKPVLEELKRQARERNLSFEIK